MPFRQSRSAWARRPTRGRVWHECGTAWLSRTLHGLRNFSSSSSAGWMRFKTL
jgi:hypothetical protein